MRILSYSYEQYILHALNNSMTTQFLDKFDARKLIETIVPEKEGDLALYQAAFKRAKEAGFILEFHFDPIEGNLFSLKNEIIENKALCFFWIAIFAYWLWANRLYFFL